jgi:hypothetical protein
MTPMIDGEEHWVAATVDNELAGARLGDARRTRRLVQTARSCAERPQSSLPKAISSKTALNSTYNLFGDEAVNEEAILQPHRDQTRDRCAKAGTVLVVHDTTEFVFSTHRRGLGHLRSLNDHGFLMHGSLALTADEHHRPLGVLSAYFWTRSLDDPNIATDELLVEAPAESERWFRQCVAAKKQLGSDISCIHVMDREGDCYELFADLIASGSRFIIRNRVDRIARSDDEGPTEHLRSLGDRASIVCESTVPIRRREAKAVPVRGKSLLPREARTAKLAVRVVALQVRKPPYLVDAPMWLEMHAVYVNEVDAPEGVEPIDWILLTTEPIDALRDILAIIEHYRARWIIEEWHKAIKTGCDVEKLQLESYDALKNAIAMYLVLAWRMLLLRTFARSQPDLPAEVALSPSEIEVLRLMQPDAKLPQRPTVAQAFVAIALMGGYIKHRVPPGWLTLARGFEKLTLLETGWSAARRSPRNAGDP